MLIFVVAFIVLIVGLKLYGVTRNALANRQPIVSIEATNEKVYSQGQEILASDFSVTATHKGGGTSSVSSSAIRLDKDRPDRVGKETSITVSLKENKKVKCKVKVKNQREEVASFECGKPVKADVKAVLYSNGELCFEGEGDVRQFSEFPWLDYGSGADTELKSVTFEKGVTPTSMDGWFAGLDTLEYVDNIPNSVTSMENTFNTCSVLTELPDMTNAESLLDINSMCYACESLKEVPNLPTSVASAESAFEGCLEITRADNLGNLLALADVTRMFADCEGLCFLTIPSGAVDLTEMATGCINLTDMPEIPESATTLTNTFSECTALKSVQPIPANVTDLSGLFRNCTKISGELTINANPTEYNSCLSGTAISTKINLTGSSGMLDIIALTCETKNVTVNGALPNENAEVGSVYVE